MSFGEFIAFAIFLGAGLWVFYRIRRTIHDDRDWRLLVQNFTEDKGLAANTVSLGPGEYGATTRITWQLVMRWWSRNPSMAKPPTGSKVYMGKNNGITVILDTVLIRKYMVNLYDEYMRIAVELPAFPRSLSIHPTSRIRRIAGFFGFKKSRHDVMHRGNLIPTFSTNRDERNEQKRFLSAARTRILAEYENKIGGVYVNCGKVFLIKRRKRINRSDLYALYDDIIVLARELMEAGDTGAGTLRLTSR